MQKSFKKKNVVKIKEIWVWEDSLISEEHSDLSSIPRTYGKTKTDAPDLLLKNKNLEGLVRRICKPHQ